MSAVADPTEAVAAYLLANMGAAVEGRVYRPELPESVDPKMKESALLVMPAGRGKLMSGVELPVIDSLVDILCYGTTRLQADNIAREAENWLDLLKPTIAVYCPVAEGKVLLYWARVASGVVPRITPEVLWPFSEQTIQVLHSRYVLEE